jgi:hypothetical protein
LVCLKFFSKHVTLYHLKAATTRSCFKNSGTTISRK